ncbi:hypothetical protein CVT25_004209 [Psilocybe cyanescens]|uniref:Uncharacterized protein n=1 Tax=Psilocybe cyanescens TaxID=93625 RepID=A0A409W781_PSICY|nr:hypothetical protein CVT25_004209 [Psilocybe cyanescens]
MDWAESKDEALFGEELDYGYGGIDMKIRLVTMRKSESKYESNTDNALDIEEALDEIQEVEEVGFATWYGS